MKTLILALTILLSSLSGLSAQQNNNHNINQGQLYYQYGTQGSFTYSGPRVFIQVNPQHNYYQPSPPQYYNPYRIYYPYRYQYNYQYQYQYRYYR